MKEIAKKLGLPETASQDEILAAIATLQNASRRPISSEAVDAKVKAGLSRRQAEIAVQAQEEHNARLAKAKAKNEPAKGK